MEAVVSVTIFSFMDTSVCTLLLNAHCSAQQCLSHLFLHPFFLSSLLPSPSFFHPFLPLPTGWICPFQAFCELWSKCNRSSDVWIHLRSWPSANTGCDCLHEESCSHINWCVYLYIAVIYIQCSLYTLFIFIMHNHYHVHFRSDYRCTYHLSALCEVSMVHIGHYSSATPGTSSTGVDWLWRALGLYCTVQDQQDC